MIYDIQDYDDIREGGMCHLFEHIFLHVCQFNLNLRNVIETNGSTHLECCKVMNFWGL